MATAPNSVTTYVRVGCLWDGSAVGMGCPLVEYLMACVWRGWVDVQLSGTILKCGMEHASAPSWLLAILWAAEANSLPATVWTVLLLAQHPELAERVRQEVQGTSCLSSLPLWPPVAWLSGNQT